MKRIIGSLLFILLTANLYAQEWAPVGAKWTYSFLTLNWATLTSPASMIDNPITMECIGDTLIQNKSCRIINRGFMNESSKSYLYYENEKIYMYIDSVVGFHTLYDFSARTGDNWTIIAPSNMIGDTLTVVVDSIGTKLISGKLYRVQYTHTLNPYNSYWHLDGEIIEDIGNINNFFPTTMVCGFYSYGPVRCYEDRFKSVKLSKINCDSIRIIWNNNTNLDYVSIYPIPTKSDLFVKFNTEDEFEYDMEIYSDIGEKVIFVTNLYEKNASISLEKLSKGLYFLRITTTTGQTIIRKIIKG
jgi:hypothetical protein